MKWQFFRLNNWVNAVIGDKPVVLEIESPSTAIIIQCDECHKNITKGWQGKKFVSGVGMLTYRCTKCYKKRGRKK